MLVDGDLAAYVRIGYLEPSFAVAYRTLPFFAWIALPIFLLAPLFYYLIRQGNPPAAARQRADQDRSSTRTRRKTVELEASGEVGEFVRNFNQLMQAAEQRVQRAGNGTHHACLPRLVCFPTRKPGSSPSCNLCRRPSSSWTSRLTATYANEKLDVMLGVDPVEVINKKPHEWCQHPDLLAFLSSYNGRKKGAGTSR